MLRDLYEQTVSTDSLEAIAAINHLAEQFLGYGKDAEATALEAIAADPNCAIAHAYAAAYYLTQENAADWQRAKPHLATAQRLAGRATERERLYITAIAAWAEGNVYQAVEWHEILTERYPRDLISVQQGQYHYFYLGDRQKLLRIAEKVRSRNPDNHYLYGMIAFGLEQCHRLSEAEAIGRHAVDLNRNDPWAHHAVAHVMETQARTEEGILWMEQFAENWDACNSMLYTHNWWHIALYYLAKGDMQTVLKLYDRHVWGQADKPSPKDQVGAIALLLRLELRGVNVGDRWSELSTYLVSRIHEHALPFQDLHYVYALARAGQIKQLTEMLQSMQAHAETINSNLRQAWTEVAVPAARGMAAHATRDWLTAIAELHPVLPQLWAIGGSHAQRDLFEQVYLDALLRDQRSEKTIHFASKSRIPSPVYSYSALRSI